MTYKKIKIGNELYVQAENPHKRHDHVYSEKDGSFLGYVDSDQWQAFDKANPPILWLGEEFEGVKTEDEIEIAEEYIGKNPFKTAVMAARLKPIEQKQEQPVQQEQGGEEREPETDAAKLRNALTPIYSLASNLLLFLSQTEGELFDLLKEQAERIEANRPIIDDLLNRLDLLKSQSTPKDLADITDEEKEEVAKIMNCRIKDRTFRLKWVTDIYLHSDNISLKAARYLESKGYKI